MERHKAVAGRTQSPFFPLQPLSGYTLVSTPKQPLAGRAVCKPQQVDSFRDRDEVLASARKAVVAFAPMTSQKSDRDTPATLTPASSLERLRDEAHLLETLNRVGKTVAAELDLERVVQVVTDAGTELSGAAFGSFFYNRLDENGEAYWLYTISGVPREEFAKFPMPRNTAVFTLSLPATCAFSSGSAIGALWPSITESR